MLKIALKMLVGERGKYVGIILGLLFASFIITQQAAIFLGLMSRTYGFITDTAQPDIWVVKKRVQFVDDVQRLNDTDLFRVRSLEDVEWAVPMFKGMIQARLQNGNIQNCNVIGIDDASLIGGPPKMAEGTITDLRQVDGVIANKDSLTTKLALNGVPLQIGDEFELNDHRAKVVGVCETTKSFQLEPTLYTTFSRATQFAPKERRLLSFILVKAANGVDPKTLCQKITRETGFGAYTQQQFSNLTFNYYMENTGIPINFGIAVIMGFIIGASIAGQTFYNFILDNLRYLGIFKAMGANNHTLVRMTIFQVAYVGFIGWGLGVGLASLFGYLTRNSNLSFHLHWKLLIASAVIMLLICISASLLSLRKVFKIEPAIVFR